MTRFPLETSSSGHFLETTNRNLAGGLISDCDRSCLSTNSKFIEPGSWEILAPTTILNYVLAGIAESASMARIDVVGICMKRCGYRRQGMR